MKEGEGEIAKGKGKQSRMKLEMLPVQRVGRNKMSKKVNLEKS